MNVIERDSGKESCFGCKHLEVKHIWRGAYTASCAKHDGGLIPHEWTGSSVVINGIGDFCTGKEI